jgi:hypothetical protein
LLEDLGGQRHLIGSDLEHDLVVQARDRAAICRLQTIDPRLDLDRSSVPSAGPRNDIPVALAWPARAIEPVDDSRDATPFGSGATHHYLQPEIHKLYEQGWSRRI